LVDDDVELELEELRRTYRVSLPAKVDALATAVDARDRETASALAHRLRGTSGAYGLSAVSIEAGAIEDALAEREIDWGAIAARLESLEEEASRVPARPTRR